MISLLSILLSILFLVSKWPSLAPLDPDNKVADPDEKEKPKKKKKPPKPKKPKKISDKPVIIGKALHALVVAEVIVHVREHETLIVKIWLRSITIAQIKIKLVWFSHQKQMLTILMNF